MNNGGLDGCWGHSGLGSWAHKCMRLPGAWPLRSGGASASIKEACGRRGAAAHLALPLAAAAGMTYWSGRLSTCSAKEVERTETVSQRTCLRQLLSPPLGLTGRAGRAAPRGAPLHLLVPDLAQQGKAQGDGDVGAQEVRLGAHCGRGRGGGSFFFKRIGMTSCLRLAASF